MIDARDLVDGPLRVRAHRNESPLPPPQHVVDAIRNAGADLLRWYPADLQRRVARSLAKRLGLRSRNVVLVNGADEGILAAARLVLDRGDNAIVARPTFGMYARAVAAAGGSVREVPYTRRWSVEAEAFVRRVDDRTRLIYLCHPNNPTGDPLDPATLDRLVAAAPRALVVVDEVYLTLRAQSLVRYAASYPNVAILGSLSKVAGLAGLRVGYLAAAPMLARAFRRVVAPFAVSSASLLAAEAYLADGASMQAFERAIVEQSHRSLNAIAAVLAPYVRGVWRGPAGFVLADIGVDARPLSKALRRRGIAVRVFTDPLLRTCVRIGALDDDATACLAAALAVLLPAYAVKEVASA